LKTNDPFGEISNGRIRLRGPVCKFGRQTSNSMAAITLTAAGKSYPRDLITTNWDSVPEIFPEEAQRQNVKPHVLYLMAFELHTGQHTERTSIMGLIIEPVLGVRGCYRRTGTLTVSRDSPGWDEISLLS
jgi:hypothetical protein